MKVFKIRCSQIAKIMGDLQGGLTAKQEERFIELSARDHGEGKPLTLNMREELIQLENKKEAPLQLPETAKTYLKEWYAEQLGDIEEIKSKYLDKGNACEDDAIEMVERQLGYFMLSKNEVFKEDDYIMGTADVIAESEVIDTKCPWNMKTFLDAVLSPLSDLYSWQMIGYTHLYNKESARVCFCLVNTPDFVNYGTEVVYSHIPEERRFHFKTVIADLEAVKQIHERVEMCREWLLDYNAAIVEAL